MKTRSWRLILSRSSACCFCIKSCSTTYGALRQGWTPHTFDGRPWKIERFVLAPQTEVRSLVSHRHFAVHLLTTHEQDLYRGIQRNRQEQTSQSQKIDRLNQFTQRSEGLDLVQICSILTRLGRKILASLAGSIPGGSF